MSKKKLGNTDKFWIQKLRGHGFSQAEIGKMLDISQQRVAYQLQQMKKKLITQYPFLDPKED